MANDELNLNGGAMSMGKSIPGAWWIDLLRREGVLLALVVGYAYYIAIPESKLKQEALQATQGMAAGLQETVVKMQSDQQVQTMTLKTQAEAVARLDSMQSKITDEHLQMLDAQKKALANHERILESETLIVKNQGVILENINAKASRAAAATPAKTGKPNP